MKKRIKQVIIIYDDNSSKGYNKKAFLGRFMEEIKGTLIISNTDGLLKEICNELGLKHF